jgi:hypothetical protein
MAMNRGDLWLVRGLAKLLEWMTWLCTLPLMLLLGLLVGQVVYWLAEARWIRATLCTLNNYLGAPNIPKVNQFVAHELDRSEVNTGARGVDVILSYLINDMPLLLSGAAISMGGLILFIWAHQGLMDTADRIERQSQT